MFFSRPTLMIVHDKLSNEITPEEWSRQQKSRYRVNCRKKEVATIPPRAAFV